MKTMNASTREPPQYSYVRVKALGKLQSMAGIPLAEASYRQPVNPEIEETVINYVLRKQQ
jgi:hypothetical protein